MDIRFGISMRVTNANGYNEPRDTISRDWSNYIINNFPSSSWLFIPNIRDQVIDYVKNWDLNVLILSGGDDLGVDEDRDRTEFQLLEHAITKNMPVIGICRGLQLIHKFLGGQISHGDRRFISNHRATRHNVKMGEILREVNSYHDNVIDESSINYSLDIVARCTIDNSIEAFKKENILALMWHPEREENQEKWNKELINDHIIEHEN